MRPLVFATTGSVSLPWVRRPQVVSAPRCSSLNAPPRRAHERFRHDGQARSRDATVQQKQVAAHIRNLCRSARVNEAAAFLQSHRMHDSEYARSTLISYAARHGDLQASLRHLRQAEELNLTSCAAYTAAIHALAARAQPMEALSLFKRARNRLASIDAELYRAAIRAAGRAGRLQTALSLLHSAREGGIDAGEHGFEGVLYACAYTPAPTHRSEQLLTRAFVVLQAAIWQRQASARVLYAAATCVTRRRLWHPRLGPLLLQHMCRVALHEPHTLPPRLRLRFVTKIDHLRRLKAQQAGTPPTN